ncbi:MAG: pentapeptide repeat-containing protein [Alkalinema sp. FL-bin-369]|nr:pentapeptide repeat-containing protein [Leptolyngbyaceae cyanobacterium LF-bin-369]
MIASLIATIATLLSTGLTAQAENPAHVKQLLETGQCPSCNLVNADLTGAHLIGADLRNANLMNANLTGANLEGADLTGATLVDANLQQAYFTHADLRWANLTRTNLQDSVAYRADTRWAVLRDNNILNAKLLESGISVGGPEGLPDEPER